MELERERVAVHGRDVLMPVERVDVWDRQIVRFRRDIPIAGERPIGELFRLFCRQSVILIRDMGLGLPHVCMDERTVRFRLDACFRQRTGRNDLRLAFLDIDPFAAGHGKIIPSGRAYDAVFFRRVRLL